MINMYSLYMWAVIATSVIVSYLIVSESVDKKIQNMEKRIDLMQKYVDKEYHINYNKNVSDKQEKLWQKSLETRLTMMFQRDLLN